MKLKEYYIITFTSTHHAIKFEDMLKKEKLEGELIPTPREIDTSCGLSIKLSGRDLTRIKELTGSFGEGISLYKSVNLRGRVSYNRQKM